MQIYMQRVVTVKIMEKELKEEGVSTFLYDRCGSEIVSRGIVSTPAVVIDSQVILSGKCLHLRRLRNSFLEDSNLFFKFVYDPAADITNCNFERAVVLKNYEVMDSGFFDHSPYI